jgi:hypothetical protein
MNARASLALAALACVCGGTRGGNEPDPEPKARAYKAPLKSVYLTFKQEGTKPFKRGSKEDPNGELDAIWKLELRDRQLFLVRAGKVGAAAKAARKVLSGGHKGDAPASAGDGTDEYWLVAYLGTTGSTPPAYSVLSAERQGRTIRLSVEQTKPGPNTNDLHPYFVWVPLGKIPDGTYTLEFYEDGKRDKDLDRKVVVKTN